MEHRSRLAPPSVGLWLVAALLAFTHWAGADESLIEFKLKPTDIAEVSIADSATIQLTATAADNLRSMAAGNAGKTLRVLFRSIIVQDAVITEPLDTGVITVAAPSVVLKEALECWKNGCPEADDDEDCD